MKKYFIIITIASLLYQCKNKEKQEDIPQPTDPSPIDYNHPCRISSFFSNTETTRVLYVKNKEGKMVEKTASYYTGISPASVKTKFEYNTQGQLVKTSSQILLPSPAEGGNETYEYDAQGRIIKKITLSSPNSFVITQWWEYNKDNRVEKIKQKVDNIDAPIYIQLVYDADGDLIQTNWCDVGSNQCVITESYEYDKTKPYYKIPETFIIETLKDIYFGPHFLKKKNTHNSKGQITSFIIFTIQQTLPGGYPTLISAYPEGNENLKVSYVYDYDCQ